MIQPNKIFKYFKNSTFQNQFVDLGEVYFNSLSYFLTCEDSARRDITEPLNVYRPDSGLKINITDSEKTLTDQRFLISQIKNPHRVFIFCTSLEFSGHLQKKFDASGCVEIYDLSEFKKRLQKALIYKSRLGLIKNKTLLSDKIQYYEVKNEPKARHACPDQIIMSKPFDDFSDEKEYRFAFSRDKDAFNVNNVQYLLSPQIPLTTWPNSHQVLRLGSLRDICKIVDSG